MIAFAALAREMLNHLGEGQATQPGRDPGAQLIRFPLMQRPIGSGALEAGVLEKCDPFFPAFCVLKHAVDENDFRLHVAFDSHTERRFTPMTWFSEGNHLPKVSAL